LRWRNLDGVAASWHQVLLGLRRGADALSFRAQLARPGGGDLALAIAIATATVVIDAKTTIPGRVRIFSAVARS
jgi:hypothetical protein